MVKNDAYKSSKEYLGELNPKVGNTLKNREDGIEQSIRYLEKKFKVNQHSDDLSPYMPAFKKIRSNPQSLSLEI